MEELKTLKVFSRDTPLFIGPEYYIIKKERKLGEEDLERLVKTSIYEGCWLFSEADDFWFHVPGIKTITFVDGNPVNSELDQLRIPNHIEQLLGENVEFYHTHPLRVVKEDIRDGKKQLKHSVPFKNKILARWYYKNMLINSRRLSILPSEKDVDGFVKFQRKVDGKCKLTFKIASPYGITSMEFNSPFTDDQIVSRYEKTTANSMVERRMRHCNDFINSMNEQCKDFTLDFYRYPK